MIDRLVEEHEVIHDVLETLDSALAGLMTDPAYYTPLREAVVALTDTLTSHLTYEERELVEPLARYGFYRASCDGSSRRSPGVTYPPAIGLPSPDR